MPCDYRNAESLNLYRSTLAEISNILDSHNIDEIIVTGDMNFNFNRGNFYNEIQRFTSSHNLQIADLSLPADSHTYTSKVENCFTS